MFTQSILRSVLVIFAVLAGSTGLSFRGSAPTPYPFTSCASNPKLTDLKVYVSPDPPVAGDNVTVTASGQLSEQITAGNVNVQVKLLGIPVINDNFDLCTKFAPKVTCPISAGQWSLDIMEAIPSITPHGTYEAVANITDQNQAIVACASLQIKIT